MSVTLATVADALIEFILSLLRDPEESERFNATPSAVLAERGLSGITAQDVCAVAPVVAERPQVVLAEHPAQPATHVAADPVVREIQTVTNNLSWIDDRDTIVDQSVNQNIWADGDVTQTFDQSAVLATGDGAIAAGDDVSLSQTEDNSTDITAGGDANVGNETTTTTADGSNNTTTDESTTTDASTDAVVDSSFTDESATATADDSFDSSTTTYEEQSVDVDANTAYDSSETTIVDETGSDDGL
ncbi:IniB N-terminal domain-containing protein [Microbacterium fluvii]|uniref:IniB N-terminal domain-containing protein n=1 Tax=Microbacterium fluvii TaxID=415215 RepID=A0ABW2HDS3_9MICO|nr:IniB N-terminal domain-containing protein [Microbacterium fluvii]MCU4671230.1 IniB N-terminal domain-containing protein [Microbacterium fluvii]